MHQADPAPPEPVLDPDRLSAMTGGDAALAAEVIGIFRQQTAIWSRLLDPREHQAQWADAAHSLKGSALSVGALRLAAACAAAERTGREDRAISPAEASVRLSAVKDEIGPAIEAAARLAYQLSLSGRFSLS